jgi:hypothetical protein
MAAGRRGVLRVASGALLSVGLACSSGGGGGFIDGGAGGSSGMGGSSGGGGGLGGGGGAGGSPQCKPGGQACQAFGECCSGACAQQVCTGCTPLNDACTSSSECCVGLLCNAGKCSACVDLGASCTLSTDCCSGICKQGTCAPCGGSGAGCTGPTECCTGVCAAGKCGTTTGAGACTNPGDEFTRSSFDLEQESYECFTACNGFEAACIASCLSGNTMLSPACALCYGEGTECVANNCLQVCLGGIDTPDCVSCRLQFCAEAFTQCSGWIDP